MSTRAATRGGTLSRAARGLLFAACAWTLVAGPAHAQTYRSTTTADAAEGEQVGAEGATSSLSLADAAEGATSIAHELRAAPSVDVRRSGALGSPAYVSVRGADPYQVRVTLDGVPLNGARGATFDLSLLPAELVDRATVYRASTPVQLGAPLPGGAVALETRFGQHGGRAHASAGSFGTRRVTLARRDSGGLGDLLVVGNYAGASNRFRHFDDGGTPLNPSDDTETRRENAHVDRGAVLIRHRATVGGWRLTTLGLGSFDLQGVPGLGAAPAVATELRRGTGMAALRFDRRAWPADAVHMSGIAAVSVASQRYRDPRDEVGLGVQDTHELSWLALVGLRPSFRVSDVVTARTVVDWSHESTAARDDERAEALPSAHRDAIGLGAELELGWLEDRVVVQGAGRVDIGFDRVDDTRRESASWAPNAGVSVTPVRSEDVSVTGFANVGLAERQPAFFELFGDNGATVGNSDLRAERRVGADVGLQLALERANGRAALTYAFFDRRVDDLIVFVVTGLGVATPQNVGLARMRGHELAFSGSWLSNVEVGANWTFMDALDGETGAALPGRPTHRGTAYVTPRWRWFEASYRVDGSGSFFVDRSGARPMPRRIEHHITATARPRLRLNPVFSVALYNVGDARTERVSLPDGGRTVSAPRAIADFIGQPLPGRAFYATISLSWRPE